MDLNANIYVAGHRSLVGSAIMRRLQTGGYRNLIARTHAELDLTEQGAVRQFFTSVKPEYVFLATAGVGGIHANNTYPAEFAHQNPTIQTSVIHEAYVSGVKRLLFLGSSCIYPRNCPQPIKEEHLLTGPLEATNRPYAIAKIAGIEMCAAYNLQYGTRFLSVMPTNCYGPGDNYDLQNSHVLPALIRKMHEAEISGAEEVVIWGSGRPRREFIYSDDLADACVFLMSLPDEQFSRLLRPAGFSLGSCNVELVPLINIGVSEDRTISELAELVREVVRFEGSITWDTTKPDGRPRKRLDESRLQQLEWHAPTALRDGIAKAYHDFVHRQE